jgi:hypothetical protein
MSSTNSQTISSRIRRDEPNCADTPPWECSSRLFWRNGFKHQADALRLPPYDNLLLGAKPVLFVPLGFLRMGIVGVGAVNWGRKSLLSASALDNAC